MLACSEVGGVYLTPKTGMIHKWCGLMLSVQESNTNQRHLCALEELVVSCWLNNYKIKQSQERKCSISRYRKSRGISDHAIVFVKSNISATRSKPPQRKIFLWKRANYVGMKEILSVILASASDARKSLSQSSSNQFPWGHREIQEPPERDPVLP